MRPLYSFLCLPFVRSTRVHLQQPCSFLDSMQVVVTFAFDQQVLRALRALRRKDPQRRFGVWVVVDDNTTEQAVEMIGELEKAGIRCRGAEVTAVSVILRESAAKVRHPVGTRGR